MGDEIVESVQSDIWCSDVVSFNPASRWCVDSVVYQLEPSFNHYPFLTYIYITNIILTEITVIFNCYRVPVTQLTTFVCLYFCNNITPRAARIAAKTCWWEHGDWNML
jgi:hypothetical protein